MNTRTETTNPPTTDEPVGRQDWVSGNLDRACARVLRKNAPPTVATNIVLSGLSAIVAWMAGFETEALVWLAVSLTVNTSRLILARSFDADGASSEAVLRWSRYYALLTVASGCVWGSVGFLFFTPGQPNVSTFFVVMAAGITAGAVSSMSAHYRTLCGFLVPALVPLSAALMFQGESIYFIIPGAILLYLVMLLVTGRNINQTLRGSLAAQFRIEAMMRDLVVARDEATVANKAKSDFLSSMSHEIRTPLNGILGMAYLLRDSNLDTVQRGRLDNIWNSCTSLRAIIDDVLDMSKIEAGSIEIESVPFDFRALVGNAAMLFGDLAREKGLAFGVGIAPERSEAVRGDPTRIRQVLWNLLSNGIKFTQEGSVSLQMSWVNQDGGVTDDSALSRMRIVVEDTGIGIEPDRLNTIFEPFTQADISTTRQFGGSGLGLSIIKNLVALMDGTISVTSTLGQGSRFVVELPLARTDPALVPAPAFLAEPKDWAMDRPLRVLLAEDQPLNALVATELIQRHGHRVHHVVDGAKAIEAMDQEDFDLILMDAHMPVMDGLEATRRIRASERGRSIPIIAVTADTLSSQNENLLAAGVDIVLTKPYADNELMALVKKFGMHRSTRNASVTDTGGSGAVTVDTGDRAARSDWRDDALAKFDAFARDRDPALVLKLVQISQSSTRDRMVKLRQAVADGDASQIDFSAHSLIGSSGSFFAAELSSLAGELREANDDPRRVAEIMPRLETAADDAMHWWHGLEQRLT